MAIIGVPSPPSRWRSRHYILAALTGSLAAIAITAVVSIALSPAHIYFSLADFAADGPNATESHSYKLTLTANNTSQRAQVRYSAITVEIWYSTAEWHPAEVNTNEPQPQPPRNSINITVPVKLSQKEEAAGDGGCQQVDPHTGNLYLNSTDKYLVVVKAQIRFWFGCTHTRPYFLTVSCPLVELFGGNGAFPVSCTG